MHKKVLGLIENMVSATEDPKRDVLSNIYLAEPTILTLQKYFCEIIQKIVKQTNLSAALTKYSSETFLYESSLVSTVFFCISVQNIPEFATFYFHLPLPIYLSNYQVSDFKVRHLMIASSIPLILQQFGATFTVRVEEEERKVSEKIGKGGM